MNIKYLTWCRLLFENPQFGELEFNLDQIDKLTANPSCFNALLTQCCFQVKPYIFCCLSATRVHNNSSRLFRPRSFLNPGLSGGFWKPSICV